MSKNSELSKPNRPHAISFDPSLSRTEQSHKAECDINNIMARYTKTGTLEHVRRYEGQYLDIDPIDFQEAQNRVAEAKTMFEELPSQVRRHFANDTSRFLEFCTRSDDPAGELGAIAEEYRKQALGIDPDRQPEQQTSSGKDAAPGEGAMVDPGMDQPSQTPKSDPQIDG